MGFIQLLSGDYMLTITEREIVGSIKGKNIYRVGAFQILPLAKHLDTLTEEQVEIYKPFHHKLYADIVYIERARAILCQSVGVSS